MGMTRSDNPFEDLPEWRERRRLQEAQRRAQGGALPGDYAESHSAHQFPAVDSGYVEADYGPEDADDYYQQPPYPQGGHGHPGAPRGPQSAQVPQGYRGGHPVDDYGDDPQGVAPSGYGQPVYPGHGYPQQAPGTHYDDQDQSIYADADDGYGQQPLDNGLGLRPGFDAQGYDRAAYDQAGAYPPDDRYPTLGGPAGLPGGAGASGFGPGPLATPNYDDGEPAADEQWPGVATGPANRDGLDEGAYYDDEEEDEDTERFSWKLAAAIIVTGAVVTGGGFVLYDSFKSGRADKGGEAPIIRADQGPAKTAPSDPGGRQFANRDSKLLGRLDGNSGAGTASDTDAANRVRTVSTVRIGPDGKLILPKAPEPAETAAPQPQAEQIAGGGTRVPGINIVDNLNGSSNSGFGGLPLVVPRSEPQQQEASAPTEPTERTAAAASTPSAPLIRNRVPATRDTSGGATNLATSPTSRPPPVPGKSAVGSSWRMSSAAETAQAPAVATTAAVAPRPNASTLGAGSVARGYVAVLATESTRMQALKSFAELQQKHPQTLQDKVLEVQEADLKARGLGVMYRVIVGPAASRGDAIAVCAALKAQGYNGCWVKTN